MATSYGGLKHHTQRHGSRRGAHRSSSSSSESNVKAESPEEALLIEYFRSLSKFSFEQCRDGCDRERDRSKSSNWCEFMSVLSRLSNAESNYFSLSSVEKASLVWKSKKEHSLKSLYELLLLEFKKVKEVYSCGKGGTDFSWERKLADLLVHIMEYVSARKDMLDFYLTFDTLDGCHIDYKRLEELVKKISESYKDGFQHAFLKPVKSTFQKELSLLTDLLHAQRHISEWQFFPAVLSIQACETRLSGWHGVLPLDMDRKQFSRSIKARPYSTSSPQSAVPYLYKWWCKLHLHLLSKFSLYFHEVLREHASVYDMQYLSEKLDTDYIASFSTIVRTSAAACVCIIFDSNGMPDFKGPKYCLPETPPLSLTGINSYPFMIRVPHDFDFHHHSANIVSLIMEKSRQLNTSTQHVSQYDENLHCTYHMSQLEPRVTLVVLVNSHGSRDRDTKITNWISEIALQLKNSFVVSYLKPH